MKKAIIMTFQKRIAVVVLALLMAVGFGAQGFQVVPSAFAQGGATTGASAPASSTTTGTQTDVSVASINANSQEAARMASKLNIPLPVAEALQTFIVFITIILKVLYALLVPVAGMIGKFMSNDWVTGTVFRLDIVIETIWQFIRNLVNIVIIMYLLYVAARNIVPFGDNGQYDIKQVLPKVALALVIVNFSLFFCRTVLTLANISTTMAFSLPAQIGNSDVFAGFNSVPAFDSAGKPVPSSLPSPVLTQFEANLLDEIQGSTSNDPMVTATRYKWISSADQGKTDAAEVPVPFNPFVWAEPLGQSDRQGLSNPCPSSHPNSSYRPVTRADGSTVNQAVCLDSAGNSVTPTPIAGSGPVYAMECLHKNYAFNASDSLFSQTGPTLIANPGYNPSTKSYVMQPTHYKRILIDKEAKMIDRLSSDAWNVVYASKQAEVLSQAAQSKAGGDPSYPYYSDCVGSLDEMAFSARNAMYVYAFNLLRIPSYEKSFVDITSYSDITLRVMMSFFFLFMFFGVTIAMLVAMVARTFYIWFMMILSPIWVLTDVLKIWKGEEIDQEGIIGGFGKFLNLAMLPTILGLIMSIGFMMFHFLTYMGSLGGESAGRFNAGSISLWFNPGEAVGGLGDIFASMFGIFAIAALWVAVFAAFTMGFKNMNQVSRLIGGIKGGGEAIAKYVAKTPLDAPIVPFGKDGQRVSLQALWSGGKMKLAKLENDRRVKNEEMLSSMGINSDRKLSDVQRQEIANITSSRSTDQAQLDLYHSKISAPEFSNSIEGREMQDQLLKHILRQDGTVHTTFNDQAIRTSNGNTYKVTREKQKMMADRINSMNAVDRRALAGTAYSASVQDAIAKKDYKLNSSYIDYASRRDKAFAMLQSTPSGTSTTSVDVDATNLRRIILKNGSVTTPLDISRNPKLNETIDDYMKDIAHVHIKSVVTNAKRMKIPKSTVEEALYQQIFKLTGATIDEKYMIEVGGRKISMRQFIDSIYT